MNAAPIPPQENPAVRLAAAWRWIPTLYFSQGIPFVVVTGLSAVMYKNLGVSNPDIVFYTSWLYLPWVIKPLWSPLIDRFRTKRFWIVALQLVVGALLASIALSLPGSHFFRLTLAVFWLMAFGSATHDIAADGFYLLALPPHQQAAFVGVRSTFFKIAMIAGQGGLVWLAGALQTAAHPAAQAWSFVAWLLAGLFGLAGLYHWLVLPRPAADRPVREKDRVLADFFAVFAAFLRKPDILRILAFLLLYRFAEAQLLPLVKLFLLDSRAAGGLGLSTEQYGILYGTIGVAALILGGLLGGYVISRHGLQRLLWPMIVAMYAPNLAFIALALLQPGSLFLIGAALAVEQFGYGFGFSAYMVYMMLVSDGQHRTAHYAICTGLMALGMMLPGLAAGWLQDQLGYVNFFIWVCVATIPSFVATAMIRIDRGYGRKS